MYGEAVKASQKMKYAAMLCEDKRKRERDAKFVISILAGMLTVATATPIIIMMIAAHLLCVNLSNAKHRKE